MADMNRREFVGAAAACAACVFCSGHMALGADEKATEKPKPVDAGELSAYAKDGVYDELTAKNKFFLVRNKGRLYAVSAVCTHKAFAVAKESKNGTQLKCTKHGSLFTVEGAVVKSPAKKALPRYGISLDERNHVIVDTSKVLEVKQWNEAGAYLKVK